MLELPIKLALALLFLLLFIDFVQELRWRWLSRKHGYAMPLIRREHPQGIPGAIRVIRASQKSMLNQYLCSEFHDIGRCTYLLQALGRYTILTIDPENIKAILATQFKDFDMGDRYDQFKQLLGDGIFTLSGEGWSHSRALLRPQFSREQVSHVHTLEAHARKLLNLFRDLSRQKSGSKDDLFDCQKIFFKFTIDTATEFLFGDSVNSLSGDTTKRGEFATAADFANAFNSCQDFLFYRVIAQQYHKYVDSAQFREYAETCHRFVDYYVERALKRAEYEDKHNCPPDDTDEKRYVFLHALTKETRDPRVLRDQSLNILLAGRDTTASLMSWTVYLLARHPRVWQKLRTEVVNEFGESSTDKITFESLKKITYLRHVLNEVLRLYPVVPVNFRTSTRDTSLPRGGGPLGQSPIFIPKDTRCTYSTYALHRYKPFWGEDADEFCPDRWASIQPRAWEYIPFNGGPRICLGQQFALTEVSYIIVRILQTFKSVTTTPSYMEKVPLEQSTLTLSVKKGVFVNFQTDQ